MTSQQSAVVRNAMHFLCILLLAVSLCPAPINALRCYTCSYVSTERLDHCIWNPAETKKITNCTKKYCTIMRQESVSPSGKVVSFIRDCLDKPLFLNAVKEDFTFKTYYRSCTTDLCNDSDGLQSATSVDPNFEAAENEVIKGKNHAAIPTKGSVLAMIAICYILHTIL